MLSRLFCLSLTSALLALPVTVVHAAENGERWEYTSVMKSDMMGGMSLPPMTMQMCKEPGWKSPPQGKDQEDCQMRDYKRSGDTFTWSMQCKGGMSGHGQMTLQGNDRFTGFTEILMEEGKMRMDMTGKKLAGSCDPGTSRTVVNGRELPNQKETEALIAKSQKQAADAQAQSCRQAVDTLEPYVFTMAGVDCSAYTGEFCKKLKTPEGSKLALSKHYMQDSEAKMHALCKTERETLRINACKYAESSKDFDFMGQHCPTETRALAQRECAGRDYTALYGSPYASFCSRYAADLLDNQQKKPEEQQKEDAVKKGVNKLKDLIRW